jgi:hypothetical protein
MAKITLTIGISSPFGRFNNALGIYAAGCGEPLDRPCGTAGRGGE